MGRSKTKTNFQLAGRVLNVEVSDKGKRKRLNLLNDGGTHTIKLSSDLRKESPVLQPGDWVQVSGTEKRNLKKGKVKRKATEILLQPVQNNEPQPQPQAPEPERPCGKILVCQKSKCRKRGGHDVCRALENTLEHLGLHDSIEVQPTGCLKRCKSAPNLVVLPNKTRHSNIQPQDIPALVEQHFK